MSNPYLPVSLRLLGTYIRAHFAWHNHTYLFGLGWYQEGQPAILAARLALSLRRWVKLLQVGMFTE